MALSVTVHSSSIFCQKTTTTQESARKCKWTSSTRGQRDLRRAATLRAWLALQLELGSPPLLGEGLALVIKWIVMIVMLAFYNLHALWMKSSKSGKSIQTMAMTAILHGYIELLKQGQGTTAKNNNLIHTYPYYAILIPRFCGQYSFPIREALATGGVQLFKGPLTTRSWFVAEDSRIVMP